MKLLLNFRLLATLALGLFICVPPVFSQDDQEEDTEKNEQREQRPQRGQGGQRGGQGGQGGGQRGGLPDMSNMTKEERVAALNKIVQTNVMAFAEAVELRKDQEEVFVKTQAGFEVEMIKVQSQMRSVGRDRDKRQALAQQMNKNFTNVAKQMKEILDKDQMKAYQAKLQERRPQGGRGRGKGR